MPAPPRPRLAAVLAVLLLAAPARADDAPKKPAAEAAVPYRLSDTKHVLVRVKVNNKGPFNLILDTGAPPVLLIKKAAKEAGVKPGRDGWAAIESFELEGGLLVPDVRTRVTDLPQAVGMNAMGLAGVEVHGVIGFEVLARYRVTIDFTADKLRFVPLDYAPAKLQAVGGSDSQGSLDAAGPFMKLLAGLMGIAPDFQVTPRGSLGVEWAEQKGKVRVEAVLPGTAAAKAGFRPGDVIASVALAKPGKSKVGSAEDIDAPRDLARILARVRPGQKAEFVVKRGAESVPLAVTFGGGL